MSVISSDSPGKESYARFTTVPLKALCVQRVQRYVCKRIEIHLYEQLQIPACAALSLDCMGRL